MDFFFSTTGDQFKQVELKDIVVDEFPEVEHTERGTLGVAVKSESFDNISLTLPETDHHVLRGCDPK